MLGAMNIQSCERSSGCRVLLVEDNADLAEVTSEFMRATGLDVRIASAGQEALKLAGAFHPEIVLSDMRLPDMSGLDVLQALRSMEGGKDVVLAIYSAVSECDLRLLERTLTPSPVDVFLRKPITWENIAMLRSRLHGLRRPA
jgi:CheY-like chemotaxis protein